MRNISTICLNVLGEKQPWNWGKMGILPDLVHRTVSESVLSTIFVTSVVSGELWRGAWLPNGTNGR